MNKTHQAASFLLLLAVVLLASPARAVTVTWNGNRASDNWDNIVGVNTNWNGSLIPGTADDVVFPDTAADFIIDLNGDRTIKSATFSGVENYTLNNNTLTLSSGKLTVTGTATHTINSDVQQIGFADPWSIGGTSGLTVNGVVSGDIITKQGTGTLILNGANTYAFGTSFFDGTISVGDSSALGSGLVSMGFSSSPVTLLLNTGNIDVGNNITVSGAGAGTVTLGTTSFGGGQSSTLSGSLALGRDVTFQVEGDLTHSGVISESGGSFGITKTGIGTLALSGANTYTGTTTINNGSIVLSDALALQNSTVNINVTNGLNVTTNNIDATLGVLTANANFDIGAQTLTVQSTTTINSGATLHIQSFGVFNASNTGTTTVNAIGLLNVNGGTFNAIGTDAATAGGTINTSGTVIVPGSGLVSLNGRSFVEFPDSGPGGNGGTVNLLAGTIDMSGIGRLQANGGKGANFKNNQPGGTGGTVTISGGALTAVDSSQVLLSGGNGGRSGGTQTSGAGGKGGTVSVSSGSLSLNDSTLLRLDGGDSPSTHTQSNRGGHGGIIDVSGGAVTVNDSATVSLDGGNGSHAAVSGPGGNAGNGGQVLVSAGSFTVNGGSVALNKGNPGSGPGGFGAQGTNGLVDVTGGTFEMNGGEVYTGTFQRSGGGVFNFNDGKLTVAGGTFDPGAAAFTIDGPSAVELPTLVLTDGASAPAVTGLMQVGDNNRGRLEILNGATLVSTAAHLGNNSTGEGRALVDGAGSTWTITSTPDITVGLEGTGDLTVSNGGAVNSNDDFVVGFEGSSDGTILVTSGGSVSAGSRIFIGESGVATATVEAGSSMISASHLHIAPSGTANGTLTATGAGTLIDANSSLNVGGSHLSSGGTGILNISVTTQRY